MRQRLGQLWQTRFALSDPTETLQQRIAGMLRRAVLGAPFRSMPAAIDAGAGVELGWRAPPPLPTNGCRSKAPSTARAARLFVTATFAQKRPEFHEATSFRCCHHRTGPAIFVRSTCRIARSATRRTGIAIAYPFVYGQIDARLFPLADWRGVRRARPNRKSVRPGRWIRATRMIAI